MKRFYRLVISVVLATMFSLSASFAQVRSILPDNTFGTAGLVLNKINAEYTGTPYGMDVQADGKIIQGVSGTQFPAVRRFFANGAIDTTFGVKGYAELHYATEGHVVVLPNGKILACFGPISNNHGCYIARLTSEGAIDSTFGTFGYTTFGNVVHPDWGRTNMDPDIKVLSDNSIRLVFTNFGLQNDTAMIIKMNSEGIVDKTFGTAGKVTFKQTVWDACSFILDHKDRIIMATQSPSGYIMVTRILPDGSVDNSFGTNDYTILPDLAQTSSLGLMSLTALGLPDNSTVLLLNYGRSMRFPFAVHIKADGTQDMSYGLNGAAAINLFWTTRMIGGVVLDNGEVLISGQSSITSSFQTNAGQFAMLNTAGKSDSVFENQKPSIYFQYDPNSAGNQYTNVGPLVLSPGNKIVQAGSSQQFTTWISRYTYSGFTTSIHETKRSIGLDIYPNPADKYSIIRFNTEGNENMLLKVYDLEGKIRLEKTISLGQTQNQLVTTGWNSGLYFVEIRSGNKVSTGKLLVQH
jgi:uncharacterized delta-60 repeat protein